VPDEIVQMLTASGTPAEAKAKVDEYVATGATCPILYPLGDVKETVDAFSEWDL
jgi:5,10-methylenetetrahydromethanopterin reductase